MVLDVSPRHAKLQAYVDDCVFELKLAPWVVKVLEEPADEDSAAVMECAEGMFADLLVNKDFWSKTSEDQRRIVAHELGHVICFQMAETIRSFEGVAHEGVYKFLTNSFASAEEQVVERIADLIVRLIKRPNLG